MGPEPQRITIQDYYGAHSSFNKMFRGDELPENAERIRVDMANWLENEYFESFKDKEIDLVIAYEYYDDGRALDLDNIVKPVVSVLDGSNGNEPYLVEDDSQIKRIMLKQVERESWEGIQTDVKVEKTDSGNWREAHGRITVSFREHIPEKPIKLTEVHHY